MALDSFVSLACGVLTQDVCRLKPLAEALKEVTCWQKKREIISEDPLVQEFHLVPSYILSFIEEAVDERAFVIQALIAIGQADVLFSFAALEEHEIASRLTSLVDCLLTVETFYQEFGGIVGYHLAMIELLCRPEAQIYGKDAQYLSPDFIDVETKNESIHRSIAYFIEHMDKVAEIYPVGGAADRLRLFDPISQQPLPAASLVFCGKTLLEHLIDDVEAKEYLYFKVKGKQISIPIAMMTSGEKDNHKRILAFCKEKNFFHRDERDFFFFCQPSVPTISSSGKWALQGPMKLLLRPGGHGVLWKLARDTGCFDWLEAKGITKALIRQINNPIPSVDDGLFAFCGIGLVHNMSLGFCSCPRAVGSAEGTNVLIEQRRADAYEYTLTNIEYCDFQKYGIADEPLEAGSPFSKYPSNTNILFVDLAAVQEALIDRPIPGMLVNLKNISFKDESGVVREEPLARLESMMQNIADSFTESVSEMKGQSPLPLKTYITYNKREKTISATKKEYVDGSSFLETPEGCFLDMMKNAKALLELCGFAFEKKQDNESLLFFYHPALGPFYSIIAQKIQRGRIFYGSEINLCIAELSMQDVCIDGSLQIIADHVTGHSNALGRRVYSSFCGKCILKNVSISNEGIGEKMTARLWKKEYSRRQSCSILIEGNGEFYAENVVFRNDVSITVPSGMRVSAHQNGEKVTLTYEPMQTPTWQFTYQMQDGGEIQVLQKKLREEL